MSTPFYSNGLCFSCTRCSACCRGGPGLVFLTRPDLRRLLAFLSLDFKAFYAKYCRLWEIETGSFALCLKEKPGYDCIFWEKDGCAVYSARPVQCSTFPFWASIVESEESWNDAARDCPGIGRGPSVSAQEIEECLWRRRAERPVCLSREAARNPEKIDENTILGS